MGQYQGHRRYMHLHLMEDSYHCLSPGSACPCTAFLELDRCFAGQKAESLTLFFLKKSQSHHAPLLIVSWRLRFFFLLEDSCAHHSGLCFQANVPTQRRSQCSRVSQCSFQDFAPQNSNNPAQYNTAFIRQSRQEPLFLCIILCLHYSCTFA